MPTWLTRTALLLALPTGVLLGLVAFPWIGTHEPIDHRATTLRVSAVEGTPEQVVGRVQFTYPVRSGEWGAVVLDLQAGESVATWVARARDRARDPAVFRTDTMSARFAPLFEAATSSRLRCTDDRGAHWDVQWVVPISSEVIAAFHREIATLDVTRREP